MSEKRPCNCKNLYKIFFFLSVFLNLFFIGFLLASPTKEVARMETPPERLYAAMYLLKEENQVKVKPILAAIEPKMALTMMGMLKEFQDMKEKLTSKDFKIQDIQGFKTSIENYHNHMANTFALTMTQIAEALPEEERIKFFQRALPEFPPFMPQTMASKFKEIIDNNKRVSGK